MSLCLWEHDFSPVSATFLEYPLLYKYILGLAQWAKNEGIVQKMCMKAKTNIFFLLHMPLKQTLCG